MKGALLKPYANPERICKSVVMNYFLVKELLRNHHDNPPPLSPIYYAANRAADTSFPREIVHFRRECCPSDHRSLGALDISFMFEHYFLMLDLNGRRQAFDLARRPALPQAEASLGCRQCHRIRLQCWWRSPTHAHAVGRAGHREGRRDLRRKWSSVYICFILFYSDSFGKFCS